MVINKVVGFRVFFDVCFRVVYSCLLNIVFVEIVYE